MSSYTLLSSLKRAGDSDIDREIHRVLGPELCAFLGSKNVAVTWDTLESLARGIGCLAQNSLGPKDVQEALKTILHAKAATSPLSYAAMAERATAWVDKGFAEESWADLIDDTKMAARAMKAAGATLGGPLAATPFAWLEPAAIPQREWLYGRHLIRKEISATLAPGGVGKTSLGIAEALAMVSGRPLLGVQPAGRMRVWLWNGEEPAEELQRRIMAACIHFGLTAEDIGDRLFVNTGHELPLVLASETGEGTQVHAPLVHDLAEALKAGRIDAMIVDPFVSTHSVVENDNNAIQKAATAWKEVAVGANVAIGLAHHTRKLRGAEATAEDARGAAALIDKSRDARALNPMSETDAPRLGVPIENRYRYFWTGPGGKANMAPRTGAKTWFQLVSVDLGNGRREEAGDTVGVVAPWSPPVVAEEVDAGALDALETIMAGRVWRSAPQLAGKPDWIGAAVAEAFRIDRAAGAWASEAKRMVAHLERKGFLHRETTRNDQRKGVPVFVFRRPAAEAGERPVELAEVA